MLRKKFYVPAKVQAWAVVNYDTRLNSNQILGFLKMFVDACTALGESFLLRSDQTFVSKLYRDE